MLRMASTAVIPRLAAALLLAAPICHAQSAPNDKIILPLELVAGQPATLAVLGPDGRLQADVKLSLSDGEPLTTDETGRAHFLAPSAPGILFAQIQNTTIFSAADVRRQEGSDDLEIQSSPRIASLNGLIRIRGTGFAGDADRNPLRLNGQRVLILAASPAELVILAPSTVSLGAAKFDLQAGGQSASAQITLIRVTATPQQISPRKKQEITLRVFGTTEPISLDLRNLRPDVVQFPHGGDMHLKSSGGPDNSTEVHVKGLRPGKFSFAVKLAADTQPPDVSAARDFLQAAYKFAPQVALSRLAKLLKNLQSDKPSLTAVREEFSELSTGASSAQYQAFLRAAREALFGQ